MGKLLLFIPMVENLVDLMHLNTAVAVSMIEPALLKLDFGLYLQDPQQHWKNVCAVNLNIIIR